MNSYFDNLASKNFGESSKALRPRLGSRFENQTLSQSDVSDDSVSHPNTPMPTDSFSSDQEIHSHQSPLGESKKPDDLAISQLASLSAKVDSLGNVTTDANSSAISIDTESPSSNRSFEDQINALQNLIGNQSQSTPTPLAASPRTTTNIFEDHHNHLNVGENTTHQHTQITQSTPAPAPMLPTQDLNPKTTLEPKDTPKQLVHEHPISATPTPAIVPSPIVSVTRPESSKRPEPKRPAAPRIAVESVPVESQEQHTVTVTIGRIEVRSPQKAARPSTPKPTRPSAKIMSLDDYVQQRAGGTR